MKSRRKYVVEGASDAIDDKCKSKNVLVKEGKHFSRT